MQHRSNFKIKFMIWFFSCRKTKQKKHAINVSFCEMIFPNWFTIDIKLHNMLFRDLVKLNLNWRSVWRHNFNPATAASKNYYLLQTCNMINNFWGILVIIRNLLNPQIKPPQPCLNSWLTKNDFIFNEKKISRIF